MSIKSILVPLYGTDTDDAPLQAAFLLARRFAGHVEGLYTHPAARRMLPRAYEGVAPSVQEQVLRQIQEESARLEGEARGRFTRAAEQAGVALGDDPSGGGATAWWRTTEGEAADALAERGGACDLIVLARPGNESAGPSQATVESALFGTGGIVLLAPLPPPKTLGEAILVGWNATAQSARAVAAALPLLAAADRVTVLTVATGAKRGPSVHDVGRRLAWHGIQAEVAEVPPDRRSVGEALLDEARRRGADLLVMGAYSHSRLREMILGGATKHVLDHADLPVLMAH